MTIAENWARIETWLRANAPEALDELAGPASDVAIRNVSNIVGELPEDYRALVQIHDGASASQYGIGVFEGFVLHSLERALHAREVMLDVRRHNAGRYDVDGDMVPDPGVRKCWWHERWLPIAVSAGDSRTMIFLDLDPAPDGQRGQLVRHVIEMDRLRIVSASVATWLERIACAMESGAVEVEREDGDVALMWP